MKRTDINRLKRVTELLGRACEELGTVRESLWKDGGDERVGDSTVLDIVKLAQEDLTDEVNWLRYKLNAIEQ